MLDSTVKDAIQDHLVNSSIECPFNDCPLEWPEWDLKSTDVQASLGVRRGKWGTYPKDLSNKDKFNNVMQMLKSKLIQEIQDE